ncbi:MAG: PAS domain S-box protein [Candidatus Marinimicrobia bacterium]|nr:PAS domain S-box protein [Candidatus Neomarinimicrobiota bacterium]
MKVKETFIIIFTVLFVSGLSIELLYFFQVKISEPTFLILGILFQISALLYFIMTIFKRLPQKNLHNMKLFEQLADNLTCGVLLVNEKNNIKFWNKKAEEIFGWKKSEIINKDISILFPGKASSVIAEICTINPSGIKICETDMQLKNGKMRRMELTDIFLNKSMKKISERIIIIRDLLEISAVEGKLMQSEKLATLGHLAAGVAHEVSNPLSSIQSLVQLIQRKTTDNFIQESLKKIRENINRINRIVKELVDFSRPTTGEKTKVQINEIISSAVGLLKYDVRCEKINFHINLNPDVPLIYLVPDQIHQVVMNMLLNSIDACKDKESGNIHVNTYANDSYVSIEIIDDGEGINPDIIDRIFEPFFTTKDVGYGTGLGLSVSHGIISSIGGNIKVESTPGEGTKFTINIPIDKSEVIK